jgi:hypothetical protein
MVEASAEGGGERFSSSWTTSTSCPTRSISRISKRAFGRLDAIEAGCHEWHGRRGCDHSDEHGLDEVPDAHRVTAAGELAETAHAVQRLAHAGTRPIHSGPSALSARTRCFDASSLPTPALIAGMSARIADQIVVHAESTASFPSRTGTRPA